MAAKKEEGPPAHRVHMVPTDADGNPTLDNYELIGEDDSPEALVARTREAPVEQATTRSSKKSG